MDQIINNGLALINYIGHGDNQSWGDEKFIDIWLSENVDIADGDAVAAEKEKIRNADLSTLMGKGGKTFQQAYEDYMVKKYENLQKELRALKRSLLDLDDILFLNIS